MFNWSKFVPLRDSSNKLSYEIRIFSRSNTRITNNTGVNLAKNKAMSATC